MSYSESAQLSRMIQKYTVLNQCLFSNSPMVVSVPYLLLEQTRVNLVLVCFSFHICTKKKLHITSFPTVSTTVIYNTTVIIIATW